MSGAGNKESRSLIARLSVRARLFRGWVVGWAVMTFGSAMMISILNGHSNGIAETALNGFQVADAVPPLGKLTLGAIFAALLYLARRSDYQWFGAPIAGAVAFAMALILPIS